MPSSSRLSPASAVDLSGAQPDKVGTSFEGFVNMPNACSSPLGTGLRNQLEDLHQVDEERLARGLPTEYRLSSQGNFSLTRVGGRSALRMEVPSPPRTMLTLTFAADKLQFVLNNSPGKINSAFVDPFESQSRNGTLRVMVSNTGRVRSEYSLSVTECSENIFPVLAQQPKIEPYQVTTGCVCTLCAIADDVVEPVDAVRHARLWRVGSVEPMHRVPV